MKTWCKREIVSQALNVKSTEIETSKESGSVNRGARLIKSLLLCV